MTRARLDWALVLGIAAASRAVVVAWAAGKVVPVADGIYYHKLAQRLADGAGYTWLWPDGVVTHAAHYPVGYPWLLSLGYRLLGASDGVGALLNALVGVAGVAAVFALARRSMGPRAALASGLVAALDPALLLYTPALMTEGITASLVAVAALLCSLAEGARGKPRVGWLLALGAVVGLCTLVRPQCLLLAPLLGWIGGGQKNAPPAPAAPGPLAAGAGTSAATRFFSSLLASLLPLGVALLVCLPWTLRNCFRMGRCALVSVNGGWNLLIGAAPKATGHWAPVDVPAACREVFDEAAKDACFGEAARQMIAGDAGRWLGLVPAKLAATFDYGGAAPWYLHEAAGAYFSHDMKVTVGVIETLVHRGMLAAALVALAAGAGGGAWVRRGLGGAGIAMALLRPGWVAFLLLAALGAVSWRSAGKARPLVGALAVVIGSTALVHGVFFGAGRYSLVVFPLIAACVGAVLTGLPPRRDTAPHAAH